MRYSEVGARGGGSTSRRAPHRHRCHDASADLGGDQPLQPEEQRHHQPRDRRAYPDVVPEGQTRVPTS